VAVVGCDFGFSHVGRRRRIPGVPITRLLGTHPVRLRVQRKRPVHVRREEPTRVQRRQRLRQGLVQPSGGRRFHPHRRIHHRRLQRFQRRRQERRRIQGPVVLGTSGVQGPVQTSLLMKTRVMRSVSFYLFRFLSRCRFIRGSR